MLQFRTTKPVFAAFLHACLILAGAQAFAQTQPASVPAGDGRVASLPQHGPVEPPFDARHPIVGFEAALLDSREKIARFHKIYAQNDFRPIWIKNDGRAAKALINLMSEAPSHALPDQSSRVLLLKRILDNALGGRNVASAEIAFLKAFEQFMPMVAQGVVIPSELDEEIQVFPDAFPDVQVLSLLKRSPRPEPFLRSFLPQLPGYDALRDRYELLKWLQATYPDEPPVVGIGPLIRPGGQDFRIPRIRARLAHLGDFHGNAENNNWFYGPELERSVIAFQARHGLNTDGIIGSATIRAMNVSVQDRLEQIAVNLDRMRWLEPDTNGRYIWVNQADFRMWVMEDGAPIFTSRVVIGKADEHRTPEFSDRMTFLEANPTWTVPYSIASEELLPLLQENPNYLFENNMTLLGGSRVPPADYLTIDWNAITEKNFPYYIRQSPGPWNALGQVKFMFPNEHDIYLHDTPAKSLFSRDARAFSHGCIRVQEPIALAELLLAPQMSDSATEFREVLDSKEKTQILLKRSLPVYLTYRTAWVDDEGLSQFRDDIYGRDRTIIRALRNAGVRL